MGLMHQFRQNFDIYERFSPYFIAIFLGCALESTGFKEALFLSSAIYELTAAL